MTIIVPVTSADSNIPRYHSAVILLHWAMAIAIALMLISGVIMVNIELEKSWQFQLYQWHKSSGVLLMLALAGRIVLRAITPIPPLPVNFSKTEQTAAKLGHLLLYLAMATMVLSGWAMVSSSVYGLPTVVFGWFEWPHIPWLKADQTVEDLSKSVHFLGAISLGLLLIVHIGAVIKHRIADQENLLQRMWWRQPKLEIARPYLKVLPIGLLVAFLLAAFLLTVAPILNIFSPSRSSIPVTAPEKLADAGSTTVSDTLDSGDINKSPDNYDFIVDTARSKVSFSGTHMGNSFTGRFNEWHSQLHFDPHALNQSYIYADFSTHSASTGDAMYDGTLPENDWLASDAYPQATFISNNIALNPDSHQHDSYRVTGLLTIRNISKPVSFDMKIQQLNNQSIHFSAAFTIDRLAYRIGSSSDPDADWVSRDISIQLEIQGNITESL